jgi:hypothetical protein
MLAGLGFAKCYINDIIVFNLTPGNHMHHLQEMFGRFKEHNFKLHLGKLWVQKTNVEAIS